MILLTSTVRRFKTILDSIIQAWHSIGGISSDIQNIGTEISTMSSGEIDKAINQSKLPFYIKNLLIERFIQSFNISDNDSYILTQKKYMYNTNIMFLNEQTCLNRYSLSYTFAYAYSLIYISKIYSSNLKYHDLNNTFENCFSLQYVEFGPFEGGNNCRGMFRECNSIEYIDISPISNINDLYGTFYNCLSLKHIIFSQLSDLANITNTFTNCTKLELIELPSNCVKLSLSLLHSPLLTEQCLTNILYSLFDFSETQDIYDDNYVMKQLTLHSIASDLFYTLTDEEGNDYSVIAALKGWEIV